MSGVRQVGGSVKNSASDAVESILVQNDRSTHRFFPDKLVEDFVDDFRDLDRNNLRHNNRSS